MKQQKLLSLIRQAIEEYHMLEDGDRVLWESQEERIL